MCAPGEKHWLATHDKTMDRLLPLTAFRRLRYCSDVVDRSLDKIIALECAVAHREHTVLRERLLGFETRYQMSSEDFCRRFRAGVMGDAIDHVLSSGGG